MKKLSILALALALLLVAALARPVLAHSSDKDGKISALLHIDPDDIPVTGKDNKIHVYFNDEDGRFTVEGCFCNVRITDDNKTISETVLTPAGPKTGTTAVYIPSDNTSYGMVVTGTPKTGGFFQPFKLNFDIDVGNPPPKTESSKNNLAVYIITPTGLIFIAIVGYWFIRLRNRDKPGS